tara:strand:+ start:970 stop:1275 length:306 start_codon:yes stop_codon:yes gene_type:complete
MGCITYNNLFVYNHRKWESIRVMVEDSRIFYSKHMGVDQFADRTAAVFKNEKTGHWEVDFWLADKLVETVVMKTEYEDEVVFHNETYADNSAENYVLGYHR